MSEQPSSGPNDAGNDEVEEAGSTDEAYGNLSVEDDAEGTTDPAELAGEGNQPE